jgi:hypothetical protein
MAHDHADQAGLLKRVLALSRLQSGHLMENRLVDLLKCQEERDGIFAKLREYPDDSYRDTPGLKALVKEVLDNDKRLTLNAGTTLSELKRKMSKVQRGAKAVKAYSSR